jgi:hypothetical protein
MKITLKELRSIIRESVQKHLNENNENITEEMEKKIDEMIEKSNPEIWKKVTTTEIGNMRDIVRDYRALPEEMKTKLDKKMKTWQTALQNLEGSNPKAPGVVRDISQAVSDALTGREYPEALSPEETKGEAEELGFVPVSFDRKGGPARGLPEAVRKRIKK